MKKSKDKNKDKKDSGGTTLLWSVIMSSPGPIVVGLGLLVGKSSTQLADFFRRTAELVGIIAAYVIYRITTVNGECDEDKKARLERMANLIVGAMMLIAGIIMLALSFADSSTEKGNVIPGLSIAIMGVIANSIFWRRYTRLNREEPNAILRVQARLYRAKTLVDSCVTAALLAVALLPGTEFALYMDKIGSAIVAIYLAYCGAKTINERMSERG